MVSDDFIELYAELGLAPGCSLPALRQAYRRRVAELHPDRVPARPRDPDTLKMLNRRYAQALAFHRLHRRLPGAEVAAPGTPGSWRPPVPVHPPAQAARTRGMPSTRLLLLPSLLVAISVWQLPQAWDRSGAEQPRDAPAPSSSRSTPPPRTRVQLGMDMAAVAGVLGEPVSGHGEDGHWIYGPSWLRFKCGRLVEWYSSPLQPLPMATGRTGRTPTPGGDVWACPRRAGVGGAGIAGGGP